MFTILWAKEYFRTSCLEKLFTNLQLFPLVTEIQTLDR